MRDKNRFLSLGNSGSFLFSALWGPVSVGAPASAFETIHDTATLDPSITLSAGAPTAEWTVIESDGTVYEYTGTSITHNRVTAGDMTLRLAPANIGQYVTHLDISNDGWKGTHSLASIVSAFPNIKELRGQTNANLVVEGSLSDLPSSMTVLFLFDTSSVITGGLSDLPSSIVFLFLNNTSSVITGSLSDLPSSMTNLSLSSTSSVITGGLSDLSSSMINLSLSSTSSTITGSLSDLSSPMRDLRLDVTSSVITGGLSDLPSSIKDLRLGSTSSVITGGLSAVSATGLTDVLIQNMGLNESQVDDVIERLYTDRASFTDSSPTLNISGSNAAPSGTYQDGDPPTTGKEYIYELVNDPESEGFNTWSITYTA